jgi:hypothetical protein
VVGEPFADARPVRKHQDAAGVQEDGLEHRPATRAARSAPRCPSASPCG